MSNFDKKAKTFANTFIYSKRDESGNSTEQALLNFIYKADRINKDSEAFSQVKNIVKARQTTSVLYRIMMMDNVVLGVNTKELPASFKVFEAKDLRTSSKNPKVFIDVTGLIKLSNGYYSCKEIDKLCAYLIGALVNLVYYGNITRITSNTTIIKSSATCFAKLFTGVLDNLRVVNYSENRLKISYIATVYYLYNIMGKDIKSAQNTATSLLSLSGKDTNAYDFYYDYEKDFESIDSFVTFLTEMFKLKGLTTDTFINRWIFLYGNGTMYGTELLSSFLLIITNAYSGSYINKQKTIETMCSRELVTLSTELLRVGADEYDNGFSYDGENLRRDYE